uniref:Cytochrome c biogenesis protein CcsA n=3 Tax=Erodium TaxID=21555 RepID=B7T2P8_9ROSI|nr:cytochrome c heme attachment protein [Erodium gruinum]YP_009111618.1 cytochrome c heme attachment protein [Erodium gruinum]YP_009131146.1 cytochrome c heme attachment protein [Erodium absinthoides]YP_009131197.1 cytochrome c heme attachment protein [Erodium absinthoides]YP_009138239.1 cytochrome c heme attachment protein [Erodium chrysanthum]YP_009138269.1 cytochrome c heme attachment protein [Erodium chrysanthum]ACH47663.1 cytochrome c heme attachment protein [Erodium chrysanthum]AHH8059
MLFLTLEHILNHISFSVVSILITIHFRNLVVDEIVGLYDSSERGMLASFFCITGLLMTRWAYSGDFPLSDLYDSLIFLSWNFSMIHMLAHFQNDNRFLSPISYPSALFTQGFATSGLLAEMHPSKRLVPALQSQWLMMHVSMMLFSYAALLCGSLLSIALLIITFRKSKGVLGKRNKFLNRPLWNMQYLNEKKRSTSLLSSVNYYRSQLLHQLDFWSSRIISLGFLFLTIGILSGAVWANEAWGSYWSWDPKETWAFITWTVFAIFLHSRIKKNGGGINSAIVASIGFFLIWICYFGINLLRIGLHSYGAFAIS